MMDAKQHAECMRLTADAIERCVDGIPIGFRLESRSRSMDQYDWQVGCEANSAETMLRYSQATYYRLVPIPQPKRIPHTRETWPGWRYVTQSQQSKFTIDCVAHVVTEVGNFGVKVNDMFVSYADLAEHWLGGNSHLKSGPWEPLSVVVNE